MTLTVLIVPGLNGSGPDHWQTRWEAARGDCVRVEQRSWHDPDPALWTDGIEAALTAVPRAVIVAHSLGCAALAHWAAASGRTDRVAGALLVAPCDIERVGVPEPIARFAPLPPGPLPFRS